MYYEVNEESDNWSLIVDDSSRDTDPFKLENEHRTETQGYNQEPSNRDNVNNGPGK